MSKRAFTLVEVLVLLCILGVIAAILYPVFARSREPKRSGVTSCRSNLKQVGLGFVQYIQDYNERYPPARASARNMGTKLSGYAGSLQSYLKSDQIFQCPSEPNGGENFLIDYGYNDAVPGLEQGVFSNSANTVLNYEMSVPTVGTQAVGELTSSAAPARSRHLDGSNYSFVDGHVKWVGKNKPVGTRTVKPDGSNVTFGVN